MSRRDAKRAYALLEHPRFRAAYDFLLLREQAGEDLQGLGEWWTRFQFADEDEQAKMVDAIKSEHGQATSTPKTQSVVAT